MIRVSLFDVKLIWFLEKWAKAKAVELIKGRYKPEDH